MQALNSATILQSLSESTIHIVQCVHRIKSTLAENYNEEAPLQFSKLYIKDSFWGLEVSDTYAWNFFYVLPQFQDFKDIEDIKVVVPNCLQMVWC